MIEGVTNADSIPVLERLVQFAGARHRVIVNNIANLDTPGFRPVDVSVDDFRKQLGEAIDQRRAEHGSTGGDLAAQNTPQITFQDNRIILNPEAIGDNILFHDRNDRDPERLAQDLTENFMTFRAAADLLRSRYNLINTAIRERV